MRANFVIRATPVKGELIEFETDSRENAWETFNGIKSTRQIYSQPKPLLARVELMERDGKDERSLAHHYWG